eukprot:3119209-Karenia_brevis.AAC.1
MAALLPHEVFHHLYHYGGAVFADLFLGGSEHSLMQWWQRAEAVGGEWYDAHPVIQRVPPSRRVPFGFHGDDATMFTGEQVLGINWGSIVGPGSTLDTRLLFCMTLVSDLLDDFSTLATIYDVLKWSFNALSEGKFPEHDHMGRPFAAADGWRYDMKGKELAGGYVGCFAEMRGDWKFLKEALLLPDHYKQNTLICFKCACLKTCAHVGMRFSNFRRDADHRRTCYSHKEFLDKLLKAALVSPLIFILGFH